ncbi:succinylglutamic semialdehyde dehydrogenase [Pseudonocardia ammonioxydans]|uniref:Succinylglutamic semialdehyde dehydrogenase n=1 Tax=Pseudonocardia ammonioxydans TaxID=260086 RepID=A0A1I5FX72_PSUAM|nr:aldehyde dehydrogenase family protein [Pseudonocardia ammonioxydans]SFO28352.1 succinylglutamic semialdehyde dehydrogenase [Pseudonocardia ammonioxydans]
MSDLITVTDPSTLETIGEVQVSITAEVESAVAAADAALPGWAADRLTRLALLRVWAEEVRRDHDALVAALVAQTGKPVVEARREAASCAATLDFYAGLGRYLGGRAGTLTDGGEAHLVREPIGVTAFVTPYNYPATLLIRDLAPALAAGVTAVVKPAPQTTLVTRQLVELGYRAGIPREAVSVVVGGSEVGEALVGHDTVRAVAFTGSTAVGRAIGRLAADGVKQTLLELGGKSPSVVFADADVDKALSTSLKAGVVNAGQMCMACTRILVQAPRYEEALARLTELAGGLVVGDPRKETTDLGPLVSRAQLDKVRRYLDIAATDGTIVTGGEPVAPDGLPGHFLTPALVTGLPVSSPVVQDDIFGPVISVEPFDSEEEGIALANATPFGLAASVWTSNVDTAWRAGRGIRAGAVWVNGYNRNALEIPSGGAKLSGLGRTRGVEGIEQFTELKNIHFSVGG